MISSSVTLTNRFHQGKDTIREYFARTICATGKAIAEKTRENMYPGHFLDTGLSQDETRWSQTGELEGAIQVPTEYAAYPEFGTSQMAPRPVLVPAIMELWPGKLERNWVAAPLLSPADPPGALVPPVARQP